MTPTILVTEPEYRKARRIFEDAAAKNGWNIVSVKPEEDAFLAAISQNLAHLAIIGMISYSEAVYRALASHAASSGPAVLSRFGVGTDNIRPEFAKKWNVRLTNTPGVLNHAVAEHTMWLLGAAAKRLAASHNAILRGEFLPQTGMELYGKTLLLAGFGGIARETAKIAHFGFGMNILAFGKRTLAQLADAENMESSTKFCERYGISRYSTTLEKLLPDADALCILVSASSGTFHFLSAERLALLRKNILIVNTSRGQNVDENALYDFLKCNPSAFASLDVFETEPYVPQTPKKDLRTLENIFFTAHLASSTLEANEAMGKTALQNTIQYENK